jgi:hypothetical protein
MCRLFFVLLMCSLGCRAQSPENSENPYSETVRTVVREFVAAGDSRDAGQLKDILHPHYRVAVNQFVSDPGVTIIDRKAYLNMIRSGKLGGTPRELDIISTEVTGHTAYVRAVATSASLRFDTLYTLMRDLDGRWWLVSETPYVTPTSK